jgi:hypothetical protein
VLVDELPKGPTGKILKRAIDRNVLQRIGGDGDGDGDGVAGHVGASDESRD